MGEKLEQAQKRFDNRRSVFRYQIDTAVFRSRVNRDPDLFTEAVSLAIRQYGIDSDLIVQKIRQTKGNRVRVIEAIVEEIDLGDTPTFH